MAVNEKLWIDQEMIIFWLAKCFIKCPNGFFRTRKALFVMDSTQAHITPQIKDHSKVLNSIAAFIPRGLTKVLQPLDFSVQRRFKTVLHHLWEEWMMDEEHSFMATRRMCHATFLEVSAQMEKAWTSVTTKSISSGFKAQDNSNWNWW